MTERVGTTDLVENQLQRFAIFAGGCFWCMEPPFLKLDGVSKTISGYTGGKAENPTYEQVCRGDSGHYEAVQVVYDSGKVSYPRLLETFWRNIDPTQADGQFADRGSQYRTAIFYLDERQREQAEASKAALGASRRFKLPIATQILPAAPFYPAEDYHQQYFRSNPMHYRMYSSGSGRKGYIKKTWGEGN